VGLEGLDAQLAMMPDEDAVVAPVALEVVTVVAVA
jgi:hypothetical protein